MRSCRYLLSGLLAALLAVAGPALADYPDDCVGTLGPSAPDCSMFPEIGYIGCCDDLGRSVWCDGGVLYCIDCAELNPSCGWDEWGGWYDCGTAGGEDPTGEFPKGCVACDPPCQPGFKCVAEVCEICEPQCDGKACGSDDCGGTCGECAGDLLCDAAGQCVEVAQCKVAGAFHCDETIEGDTSDYVNMLEDYPCYWWPLPLPEVGYSFTPAVDDILTVTLESGWDTDLMVLVLEETCAEGNCLDYGYGSVQFDATKGTTYYFVVDGEWGGAGEFSLSVKCKSTCKPDCDGKMCGDDGCDGSCGECKDDAVCWDGTCQTGNGCVATYEPGCNGCLCEECVCAMDDFCCNTSWDGICVSECIDSCGGCADLTNCGDGLCDAAAGENCSNCPDDCVCQEGELCFEGACCVPMCENKECGDDGCGGWCGDCDEELFCIDNVCGPNDGCTETLEPGCGGCLCEQCACEFFDWCCMEAWDDFCVMICTDICGGCGLLENCGDGECQFDEGETCYNCPDDCACNAGETCVMGECCLPDCEGLECGDDGCGGSCGDCPFGLYCLSNVCQANNGCMATYELGCGGCPCEACVCAMDSYCCTTAWDSICVDECEWDCGGCLSLENCGDDICDEVGGENCQLCPEDCACDNGEKCYLGACCLPSCEGKECGNDGCGGSCGGCPCDGCEAEENWCNGDGECITFDGPTCQDLMACFDTCDDWDDWCYMDCIDQAPLETQTVYNNWVDCLEMAGYWECWDNQCAFDSYEQCLTEAHLCLGGTDSCPNIYDCMGMCGYDDTACSADCLWSGSLEALETFWPFFECFSLACFEVSFDPGCMGEMGAGQCSADLDACLGACVPDCSQKDCGDDGCGGSCGSCPPGVACINGECPCFADCGGKDCGSDGCGGDCGDCEKGSLCNDDTGLCDSICVPDCVDKVCGDDDCDGSCGQCPDGSYCLEGLCQELVEPAGDIVQPLPEAAIEVADFAGWPEPAAVDFFSGGEDHVEATFEAADTADGGQPAGCTGCATCRPTFPSGALLLLALAMICLGVARSLGTNKVPK